SLPTYPFAKERYWCTQQVIEHEVVSILSNGLGKDIGSRCLSRGEVYAPNPHESSGNASGTLMLQPGWREEAIFHEASPPGYEKHVVMLCEPDELARASVVSQMHGVDCLILQADQPELDKRFMAYVTQAFEASKNIIACKPRGMVL